MLVSAAAAFVDAPVPMVVVGLRQGLLAEIRLANRAFAGLVQRDRADLIGLPLEQLVHPDDAAVLETPAATLAASTEQRQLRVYRSEWAVTWTVFAVALQPPSDEGGGSGAVIALQDLTLRLQIEEELAHRATHDSLTGLSNRSLLVEHLELALARVGRRPGVVAVLFCDLDGFKGLNDGHGHRVGDEVLQETAGRILSAVRRGDAVVRMGGDEFVIVCEAQGTGEAQVVAERIRSSIARPMRLQDREVEVSASVGIAATADASADPEDLVRRADLAMYAAKGRGRDRVVVFTPELDRQERSGFVVGQLVREALASRSVGLDLLPVVDLRSGQVVGSDAVALLRRHDGDVRLLEHPDAAGQAGLAAALAAELRRQALARLADDRAGESRRWVAVPVARRELVAVRFATAVEEELRLHGLQPRHLMLRVPEQALIAGDGAAAVNLRRLSALGCRVVISEFGAGRSSLVSPQQVPAHVIAIDRAFVRGVGSSVQDEAMVAAVVALAHHLDRTVIAEGVESPAQELRLRQLGCDLAQRNALGARAGLDNEPG